jgi:predicted small lipoprotein YifL
MARRIFALALASTLFGLAACGRQAVQEPPKPPPAGERGTRLERPTDEEAPKLIAPPPAYGNKVVMAKAAGPRDF